MFVEGVVDHDRSRLDRPRDLVHSAWVGAADHVDVGGVEQVVVDVIVNVVAGDRLQQHAFWQAHATFMEELGGRRDLATGNAGQVADHAFDFGDAVFFQPGVQLIEGGVHTDLLVGF